MGASGFCQRLSVTSLHKDEDEELARGKSSKTPITGLFCNPLLKDLQKLDPICDEMLRIDVPMCIGCSLVTGQ